MGNECVTFNGLLFDCGRRRSRAANLRTKLLLRSFCHYHYHDHYHLDYSTFYDRLNDPLFPSVSGGSTLFGRTGRKATSHEQTDRLTTMVSTQFHTNQFRTSQSDFASTLFHADLVSILRSSHDRVKVGSWTRNRSFPVAIRRRQDSMVLEKTGDSSNSNSEKRNQAELPIIDNLPTKGSTSDDDQTWKKI